MCLLQMKKNISACSQFLEIYFYQFCIDFHMDIKDVFLFLFKKSSEIKVIILLYVDFCFDLKI